MFLNYFRVLRLSLLFLIIFWSCLCFVYKCELDFMRLKNEHEEMIFFFLLNIRSFIMTVLHEK